MKPDITSANCILSRKIRMRQNRTFFLFLLSSMLFVYPSIGAGQGLTIDLESLKSISLDKLVLLDTRSKYKYLLGHIPGAIHLGSWQDFTKKVKGVRGLLNENPKFIVTKFNRYGIHPNKTIVIYGEPNDPWRTDGRFFWMFERFGFNKVTIFEGGGGKLEKFWKQVGVWSRKTISKVSFNPKRYSFES